ncbi:MAG TPA: glycoside hydrolase family 15 protein [Puia sp.]|nr:glycoside hydrolase family 15 protein [Puia sp.]
MNKHNNPAPGAPGNFSPWTSGGKTGIGRALNPGSTVSFTIGKGVLNEVYFPREDIACIRECAFVAADGKNFFSDERTQTVQKGRTAAAGIPAYRLENRCEENRYRIYKTILTDPRRDVLLQKIRIKRASPEYRFYLYLTPHMHNDGAANEAWIDDFKGTPMLFATGGGLSLALACNRGWLQRTVGFIGTSNGFFDIREHKQLTRNYNYAGIGNVQLCGEPDLGNGELVIAIGFGHTPEDAAHQARSSLLDGFEFAEEQYMEEWKAWHRSLQGKRKSNAVRAKYLRESAAVLRISESRRYPGGIIASLSIPWGETKGINDGIGYHLVWPRDLVESAWGFLAMGAEEDARRILNYLFTTQDADGRWSQNMWLDGSPCLTSLQMDQVALPLLLLDSCYHRGLLDKERCRRYLPAVRKAAAFILRHGPYTQEDRWEQQAGLSPFSLATQIAGLLAAAAMLEHLDEKEQAAYCRAAADDWNAQIETWTYVRDTETARRHGVQGYYVRINPFFAPVQDVRDRVIRIKHYRDSKGDIPVGEIVSVDALALVRFGLRRPDDPRILDTIRVIDGELKKDLPQGPCWRRFSKDAYGEDDEGNSFLATSRGKGRCWPLLTGERAHYAIAAGHHHEAKELFKTLEHLGCNGFFPEQVWDGADLPAKQLFKGRYTGSAMPLTWAQAEYIKLAVSLKKGVIFDMPTYTQHRYIKQDHHSPLLIWRFDRTVIANPGPPRTHVRLELFGPARVRWSTDHWKTVREQATIDNGLGLYFADIPIEGHTSLVFTFYWSESNHWEGRDFHLSFNHPAGK